MKRKVASLALLATIFILLGFGYFVYLDTIEQDSEVQLDQIFVTLRIDYAGIRNEELHDGWFPAGSTVLNITETFANVSKTIFQGLGVFVDGINKVYGNINKTNYYWIYYVNEERGPVSAGSYRITVNDTLILWKYEG